jgi:hypothetical protein
LTIILRESDKVFYYIKKKGATFYGITLSLPERDITSGPIYPSAYLEAAKLLKLDEQIVKLFIRNIFR